MSLKNKVFSGLKWTGVSSLLLNILRVIQISVLARFLTKEDFGIVAIVMIIISFVQMFLDMGIGQAIIHKQDITYDELNSLYWLNVAIGIFLYIILYIFSPFVEKFYHISKLSFFIRLVGLSLIIQSFGKQFYTLFEKELKFELISKIQIFSFIISVIISIIIAIIGFGIYALIIPSLINSFISATLLCLFGFKNFYLPNFYFNIKKITYFIKFGLPLTIGGFINYINSKFDEILIGKLLGQGDLGLYSVSKNLVQKPAYIINPIITRVVLPAMSKIQNDTGKLKETYLKMINYIATINFFIYVLIIVYSNQIVTFLLGPKWTGAVLIVKILSFYFMLRAIGNPVGTLVVSKGKPMLSLYWNFFLFLLIPLTIFISSKWGIIGICWGWVFLMIFLMFPNWLFLVRPLCGAGFKEYFWQIARPGIFVLLILLLEKFLNHYHTIFINIFFFLIYNILFFVYNWLLNKSFLKTLYNLLFNFLKPKEANL